MYKPFPTNYRAFILIWQNFTVFECKPEQAPNSNLSSEENAYNV